MDKIKKHKTKQYFFKDEIINSLIRFHAFTGNDYISSFYRKGNTACFKILQGSSKFQSTFAALGNDLNISDDLLTKLREFVCHICGMRKEDVNEVRFVKYYSKYQNGNKVAHVSTLSPCWSVVHSKGKNSFAGIWKRCLEASFEIPSIADHGWNQNANI